MKTLDVALIPTNLNKFLFKDEYYNYSLRGKELVLSPLGKRKERRYFLTDDEISQLMSYYVAPLEKLHNEYPYSRNSPMIWWPFNPNKPINITLESSRNSPMIWWPFNKDCLSL